MRTVADLDRELARWDRDLELVFTNLQNMPKEVPLYRLLFEEKTALSLEGATKSKVESVLQNFHDLWQHFGLVQAAVESARRLRKKDKKPSQLTIDAAFLQLEGASIELPAEAKPLRSLLTPNTDRVKPRDLLDAMSKSYVAAKQVAIDIDAIWTSLEPELTRLKGEADELRALATELGAMIVELNQFDAKINRCALAVARDPLGAGAQLDKDLRPLVEAVRKALLPLKTQRDQLASVLIEAKAKLPELEKLGKASTAAAAEALDAIADAPAYPRSKFTAERLRVWLEKVDAVASNSIVNAYPLFAKWKKAADEFSELEEAALKGYSGLVEQRNELKVRFRMYKQTAGKQSYAGRIMVEDPELLKIKTELDEALARPSNLKEARQLVAYYHDRIRIMERLNRNQSDGVQATPEQS